MKSENEKKRNFFSRSFWTGAALLLVTFLAFAPALENDFVHLDDPFFITENPFINTGLSRANIRWAFAADLQAYWQPLTWLSHMLDFELFGADPREHHAVSVFLHMVNVLLLWIVLRRMTGSFWPAVFAAALFGVHPLRVESVAWVSARKDVLSAFFGLLTLVAYERYARRPAPIRYIAVFAGLALGLMSKPALVTWPFVFLLLDYWPLRRFPDGWNRRACLRLLLEKVPFFLLAAASCILTFISNRMLITANPFEQFPLITRLSNAVAAAAAYIRLVIWPSGLACFYPHPGNTLPLPTVLLSALFLIAVTGFCLRTARRRPWLAVGWFWYLVTLLPVIGLVQFGGQALADRYTYLPQIGLMIMAGWTLNEPAEKKKTKWIPACLVLLLALSVFLTRQQTRTWRDSETLYRRALDVTQNNVFIHNNLGVILDEQGRVEEALAHFSEALRIQPDYKYAVGNLGLLLTDLGREEEARGWFADIDRRIKNPIYLLYSVSEQLLMRNHTEMALFVSDLLLEAMPDHILVSNPEAPMIAATGRSGESAEADASGALDVPGGREMLMLSTLAEACAEAGDFNRAVQIAEKLIEFSQEKGNTRLEKHYQDQMNRYSRGCPWR